MLTIEAFENGVQRNTMRVTHYESGCDGGGDGGCDCIGLVIGSVRLAGGTWPWTHGSNYTARYRMKNFRSVLNADALQKNELVFKAKDSSESGYDLPDKYKAGGSAFNGDLNDYYHVGIVTSIKPLKITHCTGVPGGIKVDTALGQWRYAGWLDQVDTNQSEGAIATMGQYTVIGGNLMLRKGPGTKYQVLKIIPNGGLVTAHEDEKDGWMYVDYEGTLGYCMAKYLSPSGTQYDDDSIGAAIEIAFANVENALQELKSLITSAL